MSTHPDPIMDAFARSGEFMWKLNHLDDPSVTVADLETMRRFLTERVADPDKGRWRDADLALRDVIDAKLARCKETLSNAA